MRTKLIRSLIFVFLFGVFVPLHTVHADPEDEIAIYSEAAAVIDAKTGNVLHSKRAEQQMYPASITKIVSGLTAIEAGVMNETAVIGENPTQVVGTRVYLLEGEEVPVERLVQGLLINSGNDAGTAIAEHIADSELSFANMMNELVEEQVGVTNTNFTNPHGLHHPLHYTTAIDMARISRYAMQNDTFREIVGTEEMAWNGQGWETTIYNHHRLLGNVEGVTGIKNGYVSSAGATLVTSAEQDGNELIVVTLQAPSADESYRDTRMLLDYGFEQMQQPQTIRQNRLFSLFNVFRSETASAEPAPEQKTITLKPAVNLKGWKNWQGEFIYQPQQTE